jgi:hypothetical protein
MTPEEKHEAAQDFKRMFTRAFDEWAAANPELDRHQKLEVVVIATGRILDLLYDRKDLTTEDRAALDAFLPALEERLRQSQGYHPN